MPAFSLVEVQRLLQKGSEKHNRRSFSDINRHCVASHSFVPTVEGGITGDLTITFVGPPNGGYGTYTYKAVPFVVYMEFSEAGQQGQYFNQYIKNFFAYERIS